MRYRTMMNFMVAILGLAGAAFAADDIAQRVDRKSGKDAVPTDALVPRDAAPDDQSAHVKRPGAEATSGAPPSTASGNAGDLDASDQSKLQEGLEKQNSTGQTISNKIKTLHDTDREVSGNIKD